MAKKKINWIYGFTISGPRYSLRNLLEMATEIAMDEYNMYPPCCYSPDTIKVYCEGVEKIGKYTVKYHMIAEA